MNAAPRYVLVALIIAAIVHVALIFATPYVLMNVAFERLGAGGFNHWTMAPRVTPERRAIVRPAPDFAYSACVYDVSDGPVTIRVEPWSDYWSLSLYGANSDNFYVVGDRDVRAGGEITLVRHRRDAPQDAEQVVVSPSGRGIALIRRLAPTQFLYDSAARVGADDVCAALTTPTD